MEHAVHELIKRAIKKHKRVIFNGNGYTDEWIEEDVYKRQLQSLFFHNDLKHFFCLGTFDLMLWEKELANTIFSFLAYFDSLFFTCFLKKFMGNLK